MYDFAIFVPNIYAWLAPRQFNSNPCEQAKELNDFNFTIFPPNLKKDNKSMRF